MIVLVIATAMFVMSVWQHELLVIGFMWGTGGTCNEPFQWCSFPVIRTTIGQAYDLTLLLTFLALILSDLALWFWNPALFTMRR